MIPGKKENEKKPISKKDPMLEKIIQEDLKHLQLIVKQCKENFNKVITKYADDMSNLEIFWNAQKEILQNINPNECAYKIINTDFVVKLSDKKIFVIENGKDAIQFELNSLNKELFKEFMVFCKSVKKTLADTVKSYKMNTEQSKKRQIVDRIKNI